jgi:hypothetical protein
MPPSVVTDGNVDNVNISIPTNPVVARPLKPTFVAGLDLGQSQDYSALTILEHAGPGPRPSLPEQTWHLRHLRRWPLQTSYTAIVSDVMGMLGTPPLADHTTLALDLTGVGRPVLDLFRAALRRPTSGLKLRLVPINITGGATVTQDRGIFGVPKRDLAAVTQVALQTGRIKIAAGLPDTPVLVAELQNFRVRISASGHDSYGAGGGEEWRVGSHDDLVLAVAIALWATQRSQGATMQWVP